MRIDQFARAHNVTALRALDLEAMSSIEPDRGDVVGIHIQLQPAQPEPVVCQVDQGPKDGISEAARSVIVVDKQCDLTHMRHASRPQNKSAMGNDPQRIVSVPNLAHEQVAA